MKRIKLLLIFSIASLATTFAQSYDLKAGVNYFFDNTEYGRSTYTIPQSMTGTHFNAALKFNFDSIHSLYAGGDVLTLAGATNSIEKFSPIAYYKMHKNNESFYAGAFPREKLLSNYSSFFFQDSVANFRPMMHGFYWTMGDSTKFFNLWLDWTGFQTTTTSETFFLGGSGLYTMKNFFVEFQSYMFHYANTKPGIPDFHVNDNVQGQLALGYQLNNRIGLEKISLSAGVLAGYERERGVSEGSTPVGLVSHLLVEHKYVGLNMLFYAGDKRMVNYGKYGNRVYWNNPFLRGSSYLENRIYFKVINHKNIDGKLAFHFHFSQGQMMYEQLFTLRSSLDNILSRK